jgi:hypothetical protein
MLVTSLQIFFHRVCIYWWTLHHKPNRIELGNVCRTLSPSGCRHWIAWSDVATDSAVCTCSTQEMRTEFCLGTLKGIGLFVDLIVHWRIILKWQNNLHLFVDTHTWRHISGVKVSSTASRPRELILFCTWRSIYSTYGAGSLIAELTLKK